MKKAIDNYTIGKQIEVSAWKGQSISANSKRFFCPECMEAVALDCRGFFRHKNRTTQSIECEKRVDSPSRTTYERMGLPLFIKEEGDKFFKLYIGFSSVSEILLDEACKEKASLEIGNGKVNKVKYSISKERFDTEKLTYLPLDFIPYGNGKYKIEYINTPKKIREFWTEHSDLWGNGQFFKLGENFSRKIRPLGTIVTDTEYYFVGSPLYFQRYKNCINIEQVGLLVLGNSRVAVYKIQFFSGCMTETVFKTLSTFLMEKYHVNLLVGESELLPLWPPCMLEENYFVFPSKTKKAIFLIDSPNDEPTVFKYSGNEYSNILLEKHKPTMLDLLVTEVEIPISIDRAFNGNIQYVRKQKLHLGTTEQIVDIVDEQNESILNSSLRKIKNKKFYVESNAPCSVYILRRDGSDIKYKINSKKRLEINKIGWKDAIIILANSGKQLLSYVFEKINDSNTCEDFRIIEKIRKSRGPVISINQEVIALYRMTRDDYMLCKEIEKYIRIGHIPVQVVGLLKDKYGG